MKKLWTKIVLWWHNIKWTAASTWLDDRRFRKNPDRCAGCGRLTHFRSRMYAWPICEFCDSDEVAELISAQFIFPQGQNPELRN